MPLGQSGVTPEHFAEFVAWVNELVAASAAQQTETPSNADPIVSTSFDYGEECSQRGNLGNADCGSITNDGIYWNWGDNMLGGHSTEAVAEANYPDGAGGLGFRSWVGDGVNSQTGDARIDFPGGPQKELWIRWYQRYEQGFSWAGGSPQYDKTLYINSNGNSSVLPQHASNGGWALTMQGAPDYYQAVSQPNITWNDVFGSSSDGQFHLFEIYIKMDTNSSDGIGRMWIDGNLVIDSNGLDYSGGNSSSRQGWTWMEFHSNQRSPENGRPYYVDYDDMAIYVEPPPNTDSNGYPWIGPVNGGSGGGDYWNGKAFEADSATISRNTWLRVEAFVKLNSIQNGAAVADGVIRYWLDGQLALEHENIIFRTAQHSDMLFDKIIIAPWIGDGSPVTQTMWVDNLIVGK